MLPIVEKGIQLQLRRDATDGYTFYTEVQVQYGSIEYKFNIEVLSTH